MKSTLAVLAALVAPAAALAHPGTHELSESSSTVLHFLLSGDHASPVLAGALGLAVYCAVRAGVRVAQRVRARKRRWTSASNYRG